MGICEIEERRQKRERTSKERIQYKLPELKNVSFRIEKAMKCPSQSHKG